MPAFTPHKSVNSPVLRFRRAPNVYLLKDGTVVEGGSPHQDVISKTFLFGHEPTGVSDKEAEILTTYGFDLIPDTILWHSFRAPSTGAAFNLTIGVNNGPYARGIGEYHGAEAEFTVFTENTRITGRSVKWFPNMDKIDFHYVLKNPVQHRVEVVLRNKTFELPPYVARWEP